MSVATFTISYYYSKYASGDINKRNTRTASVYANNLAEAIQKVKAFDPEYLMTAENGVRINEHGYASKGQTS